MSLECRSKATAGGFYVRKRLIYREHASQAYASSASNRITHLQHKYIRLEFNRVSIYVVSSQSMLLSRASSKRLAEMSL